MEIWAVNQVSRHFMTKMIAIINQEGGAAKTIDAANAAASLAARMGISRPAIINTLRFSGAKCKNQLQEKAY